MTLGRRAASFLFLVVGAACGGSTSANGTVDGTVNSTPVTVTDSMGMTGPQTYAGVTAQVVAAFLTNVSGICGVVTRRGNPPNLDMIGVSVSSSSAASIPPGTYPLGYANGMAAQVSYTSADAMCQTTLNEIAKSGSITITQVTSATVDGSFDATFASGDHLSGKFSAPVCPVTLEQIVSIDSPCGS
jgi:hypothetical protein